MTAEQVLQDAIIHLQRQDLDEETRHTVDEAAQLLADGRDMEAGALVEKAQAITNQGAKTKTDDDARPNRPVGSGPEPAILSRISTRLTQSITAALAEAFVELEHDFGGHMNAVVSSLEGRLNGIAAQLRDLSHMPERVERIEREQATRASVAQEQWDRLAVSISSLEETDRATSLRVALQEERVGVLHRLVEDLSPRVNCAMEQIEQHTAVLQSMQERQAHRVTALNEVLDAIAKLREPKPLANEAAAG